MRTRKAKIVTTLGPSTGNPKTIIELINAGVDVFRLNFSHGDHEAHLKMINMIRNAEKKTGKHIAILQDISGPKIRVGHIDGEMKLEVGKKYKFIDVESSKGDVIPFPHTAIIKDIVAGTRIFFADGTMRAVVTKVDGDDIEIEIEVGGILLSKKGVNFPDLSFSIPALTKKDLADLQFGIENDVDLIAISFVRNKNDVLEAKAVAQAYGGGALIIPKIEKKDAIENIDEILEVSDGVMVARGDLGVELGLSKVPVAQKMIIEKANDLGIPVITATQMLTSMVHSPYPTRAEVSDIANAVLDGTDAVMLSDETAVGKHPIKSVEVLVQTITEAETIYPYYKYSEARERVDAIAASAAKLSESINPDGIVVFSDTGSSAKKMSKFRSKNIILVATPSHKVARQLSLMWGIVPTFVMEESKNSDDLIYEYMREGVKHNWVNPEGQYIFIMGYPTGKAGTTNLIRMIDKNSFDANGLLKK